MGEIKLVIFDMDGLMIDSETVYLKCAKKALKKFGIGSCDFIQETIGIDWIITRQIYEKNCPALDYEAYQKQLHEIYEDYLSKHPYRLKKGLKKLLNHLKKRKIPMAVATSTYREQAMRRLNDTGIRGYFDFMVCGNDLTDGKPSPQIYLKVLEHFGMNAEDALVFEDSRNGLLSASRAGIRCIIVPDICIIDEKTLDLAYMVIPDLGRAVELI